MAEMVHRLAPGHARRSLLFVSTMDDTRFRAAALPPFLREVLEFFAVPPDQVAVAAQDAVADSLDITAAGSDFGGGPHPGYLDLLAAMAPCRLGPAPAIPVGIG